MPLKFEKPSTAYMAELKEVAKSAGELCSHISKANTLPQGFPKEQVDTLCAALQALPDGTAEGSITTLEVGHQRLMGLRRTYILTGDARVSKDDDLPPSFRGETIDQLMSGLYTAIGTAIDHYKLEAGEEPETDTTPEPEITPEPGALDEAIGELTAAEQELHEQTDALAKIEIENTDFENYRRSVQDGETITKASRTELEMSNPRPSLLNKAQSGLGKTAKATEKLGEVIKASGELGELGVDTWFEIKKLIYKTPFQIMQMVGEALIEAAQILGKMAPGRSGIGNDDPPFDYVEVYNRLLAGEPIPKSWIPEVKRLDFFMGPHTANRELEIELGQELELDFTLFQNLGALSQLSQLKELSLYFRDVSDISPLGNLKALNRLSLARTKVKNVSHLTGLTALTSLSLERTLVNDLSPLEGLIKLQELYLASTLVVDIVPLRGLTNINRLDIMYTMITDLEPLSEMNKLTNLYLDGSAVENIGPLKNLKSLQSIALNDTDIDDLSPLGSLMRLKSLYLAGTRVTDLTPLAGLSLLQVLNIDDTKVTDLSPIQHLIDNGLEVYGP